MINDIQYHVTYCDVSNVRPIRAPNVDSKDGNGRSEAGVIIILINAAKGRDR